MGTELKYLFQPTTPAPPPHSGTNTTNLVERAGQLCSRILGAASQDVSSSRSHRKYLVQRNQPCKIKYWMRNLVIIDFQGQEANKECPLYEYQKIFDGLIRIASDQSESDIRDEIVRLVKLKELCTHPLELINPDSFSFVKVRGICYKVYLHL